MDVTRATELDRSQWICSCYTGYLSFLSRSGFSPETALEAAYRLVLWWEPDCIDGDADVGT